MAESHPPAAQQAAAAAAPGKTPPNKRVLGVVALILGTTIALSLARPARRAADG